MIVFTAVKFIHPMMFTWDMSLIKEWLKRTSLYKMKLITQILFISCVKFLTEMDHHRFIMLHEKENLVVNFMGKVT